MKNRRTVCPRLCPALTCTDHSGPAAAATNTWPTERRESNHGQLSAISPGHWSLRRILDGWPPAADVRQWVWSCLRCRKPSSALWYHCVDSVYLRMQLNNRWCHSSRSGHPVNWLQLIWFEAHRTKSHRDCCDLWPNAHLFHSVE